MSNVSQTYQSKINQAQINNSSPNGNHQQTNNHLSNAKVAQFHKTRMCLNMTNCPRQSRCNYAHSVSELRSNLNLSRTKVCKAFQQGKCRKVASQCNFAHGLKELVSTFGYFKTKECPDQALGCHKGVYCRNYHSESERAMAEKFIKSYADQSLGSVRHVEFYNYWSREDAEGLESFLKLNESKLHNSNSYYRRYRADNTHREFGSSAVENDTPKYPTIPRPAPLPETENGPELAPGRLNYAKIASASLQPTIIAKPEEKEINNRTNQNNTDTNQKEDVNNVKATTPMRTNPSYNPLPDVNSSPNQGPPKYSSIDYGIGGGGGAYPHPNQYGGYFLPPSFIPGMGSMQGFSNAAPNGGPQPHVMNTNVAALNKLSSLSSFNSFGSFGGPPDASASNSGPFTHFQPIAGYNMMPRDFSGSLHCSSSSNFQWPQARSHGGAPTTTNGTDINETSTPNQATIHLNNEGISGNLAGGNNQKIHQNPPPSNREH